MKKIKIGGILLVAIMLFGLTGVSFKPKVYAAESDYISIDFAYDSSCNSSVNGNTDSYVYYISGDSATLNIKNTSSNSLQAIDVNVPGIGHETIPQGSTDNYTITLGGETTIEEIPAVSTPCSSSENVSTMFISGASGSLSCSISDNKVWNISGTFDNVAVSTYMFRGSTYVENFPNTGGGPNYGNTNVTVQFSAQSTPQTYYLYDGQSSTDPLISQVTCPKITTSSSSSNNGSTSTSSKSSASESTSNTPSTKSNIPTPKASSYPGNSPTSGKNMLTNYSIEKPNSISYTILFVTIGISALLGILLLASIWKIFNKAGKKGWYSIIPFYNTWVLFEISGKPGWWMLLGLIPFVGWLLVIILGIIANVELAHRFGKTTLFAIFGLIIFGIVGYPILGFGKASYASPKDDAINKPSETS